MEKLNTKKSPDKDTEKKEDEPELVVAQSGALVRTELLDAPRSYQLYQNRDSFDEAIRPSSPSKMSRIENVENIVNTDGGKVTTVRTIKEVFGSCPQIGSKEAFGRQIRETSEKTGQGIKAFKDTKTESIIGDDGTRITRTSHTTRVKYTYGSGALGSLKTPESSFFNVYRSDNKPLEYETGSIREDLSKEEEENRRSSKSAQSSSFYTSSSSKSEYKNDDYKWNSSQQASQLRENVPVFIPLAQKSYEDDDDQMRRTSSSSSYSSSATTSRYITEEPKTDESSYSSKTYTSRFKSPFRSVPTIKEIVPPTFSYELENYTVKKGDNAIFKGTVNGSYPFEVKWYLDNNELKPSSRIEMKVQQDYSETFLTGLIDYIVSLKILKCSHQDIGKYSVLVKNEAGDASCSAFLIIEGKKKKSKMIRNLFYICLIIIIFFFYSN